MFLLLCDRGDAEAAPLAHALAATGLGHVELVNGDELASAPRWVHALGATGVHSQVRLADGRMLDSGVVHGALNRLTAVPTERIAALGAAEDREYALQELNALLVSWLHGLPGTVLNRPAGFALAGPWMHRSQWLALGTRAGLAIAPYRERSVDPDQPGDPRPATALVAGDRVLGAPPGAEAATRRLARLAGVGLLEIAFDAGGRMTSAGPRPAYLAGDPARVAAVAATLAEGLVPRAVAA